MSFSVVQCVVLCCSVLQCVTVCCSVMQCVAVCCSVMQGVAVCCRVLQCATVCCSIPSRRNLVHAAPTPPARPGTISLESASQSFYIATLHMSRLFENS